MVVIVCIISGVIVGLIVGLVVAHWPRLDVGAPTLAPTTIANELDAHPTLEHLAADAAIDRPHVLGITSALLAVGAGAVGAMVALFGLVALMVRTNTGLARLDGRAARWGAAHASTSATNALRDISELGGTMIGVALVVIVGVVEARRARRLSVVAFLLLVIAGQNVIVNVTKVIVGRARPDVDRLTGFSGASFPSGHSAQAAAMFAAFALLLGRRRSRYVRAGLAGLAVAIAVAVAATRVMLGVHWLTDIIGGLAVGWGWFALVSIAFGGRWLHFGTPVAEAVVIAEAVAPQAGHEPAVSPLQVDET